MFLVIDALIGMFVAGFWLVVLVAFGVPGWLVGSVSLVALLGTMFVLLLTQGGSILSDGERR